jgi:hypothetical protein
MDVLDYSEASAPFARKECHAVLLRTRHPVGDRPELRWIRSMNEEDVHSRDPQFEQAPRIRPPREKTTLAGRALNRPISAGIVRGPFSTRGTGMIPRSHG